MKRPLAPYLPETPTGTPDPVREMRERERASIAKRVTDPKRAAVEAASVDGAATPPKATTNTSKPSTKSSTNEPESSGKTSQGAVTPSPESQTTPKEDSTSDPSPSSEATEASAASASSAKGPRYDVKSFKRWAEQNPEQAIEFAKSIEVDVFRSGEDPKQEWIRQQSKARKIRETIETEKATAAAELKAQEETIAREVQRVEKIANEIRYVSEMWGAAKRVNAAGQPDPDFDTLDEAFRQNTGGMSIDDYNRMRARRGVSNPESARLKAENARLARLLAAAGQTNGASPTPAGNEAATGNGRGENPKAEAAPVAAAQPNDGRPADPEKFWGGVGGVPKAHPLRQFTGWAQELDAEMAKYHDETLDEYSRDAEEVANALVKRKLAALAGNEEAEPAPAKPKAAKPNTPSRRTGKTAFSEEREAPATRVPGLPDPAKLAPRGKVNTDRSHRETSLEEINSQDGGLMNRERWALDRAMRRARGEVVED